MSRFLGEAVSVRNAADVIVIASADLRSPLERVEQMLTRITDG